MLSLRAMRTLFFVLFFAFGSLAHGAEPRLKVLLLGDSLTEGFGVAKEDAYPALVEKKLHAAGFTAVVLHNAGIGGSTTASALSRLQWHLKSKPQWMLLALGANDGLRGVAIPESKKNLALTIERAQKEGIRVFLAGMRLPPNYGEKYRKEFEAMYRDLARERKLTLLPFLLEGVAGERALNLEDGIHPNEKGHQKIADAVYKFLQPLIQKELAHGPR
jgi:acyl-CoA thioesterase-1